MLVLFENALAHVNLRAHTETLNSGISKGNVSIKRGSVPKTKEKTAFNLPAKWDTRASLPCQTADVRWDHL